RDRVAEDGHNLVSQVQTARDGQYVEDRQEVIELGPFAVQSLSDARHDHPDVRARRRPSIKRSRCPMSRGLVKYATAPFSSSCALRSDMASALRTATGIALVAARDRSCSNTSAPGMSGRCR